MRDLSMETILNLPYGEYDTFREFLETQLMMIWENHDIDEEFITQANGNPRDIPAAIRYMCK